MAQKICLSQSSNLLNSSPAQDVRYSVKQMELGEGHTDGVGWLATISKTLIVRSDEQVATRLP